MAAPGSTGGSFLRKAGPLVVARLIGVAITTAIPLVLARAMELEEYGTYKQLFLIANTLYYVLPFGVAQSLYFFLPRTEQSRPWVAQTLVFMLIAGTCGGAALLGMAPLLARMLSNPELLHYQWPLAIYVMALVGAMPLEVTLTGQGKTRAAACLYLGSDALRAAAMIVPVLGGYGLQGAMLATALLSVVRLAATWVAMLIATRGPLFERGLAWRQLAYAAPFGAAMLLNIPQQTAHQYAVGSVVTPEQFAIYAVGCFQLPLVDLLYTPTSEVLMVRVGELERMGRVRESLHAFREASARLAYVFLPMAAFLWVAAPEFIAALFGRRFLDAVPIFRVSVVAVALSILPMDGLLRARDETRYLFISYLVKALVTVPAVYVGVKFFGMMGGIASWALAELVGKGTLLARVPRALQHTDGPLLPRVAHVLPWRDLGKASLAAVGAGVAVALARGLAPHALEAALPDGIVWRVLPLALVAVLFGAGYVTLLRVAGVRPFSALAAFRRES
ncbi:MAG TPA: oligosaccharide flippase family protein [Myxococcaceae bacterium]|nr:oligosaccharide flippase family protein [Myxococcaceae bacterium]